MASLLATILMSSDEFRRIALRMEGAMEGVHVGHPDFRAIDRIFATLLPTGHSDMARTHTRSATGIHARGKDHSSLRAREWLLRDARAAQPYSWIRSMKTPLDTR